MSERVIAGLSGGVDSSVAAALLKEKGYEVIGVTMLTTEDNEAMVLDAKKIAACLNIEHMVIDFRKEFKSRVIDYFMEEYLKGKTPNPCTKCNPNVKWEALIKAGDIKGASYIATGHYSGIIKTKNGRYSIRRAENLSKDQSYALYGLSQEQLKRTLMPLYSHTKDEVRLLADKMGLPVAHKPDSQDICFIPDNNHGAYIENNYGGALPGEGDFVDTKGWVLGRHKGIYYYTIGQRKGLNVSAGHRVFVSEIIPENNRIILSHEDVYSNELICKDLNFMGIDSFEDGQRFMTKIRYNHAGSFCRIYSIPDKGGYYLCRFEEPVRAITPGQSVVFYDDDCIAAGGVIV